MESLCGMRLHTVGVAIGWVGAVFSFMGCILCGLVLGYPDYVVDILRKNNMDNDSDQFSVQVIIMLGSIYLAFNIINLLASALLVAGTIKERHLMLVPWLINSGASLLFNLINNIGIFINLIESGRSFGYMITYIIFVFAALYVQFIIWYAIYSLFKKLQLSREHQHLLGPAVTTSPNYTKI